ncbi:hypothetical protein N473_13815 [Pseudoalteromonas luteoviolacea CPMOR-1]|uniref:Lipoprotein n=1 Tax=Pseudoalteromonas luteoviolacea CPMOR-1 TaxID=1365248 RepID=A0A162CAL5_9GAMM|nr:hypothetical protein [Pseudoalteromonas luteoviolacea]KZN64866.1 hypothetical protein N473_13815 [Pseudoalteromonas luteoviolacea CPMOR-1]
MRYFSTFALIILIYLLTSCSELYISIHEGSEKSESSIKTKNCVKSAPCQVNSTTQFWLSSKLIRAEEPFVIFVKTQPEIKLSSAYIEGVSMYMGKIPIVFNKVDSGLWRAEVMVGACNLAEMQWQVLVPSFKGSTPSNPLYFFSYR